MSMIPGSVTISVGSINPSTGLGPSSTVGSGLAKELADAMIPAQMSNFSLADVNKYFNQLAAKTIAHIQVNAVVATTVATTVIGTLPVGPVAATGTGAGTGTVS